MNGIEKSEPRRTFDSDTLLQASRRLDWRFLLPEPELRRVAYIGAARGALLESLRLLADRLDVWETPAPDVDSRHQVVDPYDVVVAHAPNHAALKRAVALTGPSGCLYVEARGLLGSSWKQLAKNSPLSLRQPHLWSLTHYMRTIRQLGMTHIAAFWFWPNLNNCTKIIPLDNSAPLLQFQMSHRDHPALGALLQSKVVQRLGSRLLQVAVPAFGIVASTPTTVPSATLRAKAPS